MTLRNSILILVEIPSVLLGQNHLDYYKGINNAKVSAGRNDLKESLDCYYSTFEKFDFVFARDCYNAIELSALAKDTMKLAYFFTRGIKQGLKFSQIMRIKNVSEFRNSTYVKKIIRKRDSLEQIYENSVNWELRNEIVDMFRQDQAIRRLYYESKFFK